MIDEQASILVVDDNEAQRELVATQLEIEGFQVDVAGSGAACLERCAQSPPDVVLLDVNMPGMNGIETCLKLKADPDLSDIAVLFLTGWSDDDELVLEALEAGGNDFVVKTASPKILLARVRTQAAMRQSQKRILQMAMHDELTGLYSRRFLYDAFRRLLTACGRSSQNRGLACLVADIDHFKQVNDTLGHLEGDRALRRVADALKLGLRETDIVARFGGEEFVVLLPDTSFDDALDVANKLRERVRSETPCSISLGVSWTDSVNPEQLDRDLESLLSRADRGMYLAKERGRNRVCTWEEAQP